MAAKLTSSGITFSDGTVMASKYKIIPVGTQWIFFQAAAPTGWSKLLTYVNDQALRVVSGSTGGSGLTDAGGSGTSGGSINFTTACSPTFKYAGQLSTTAATGSIKLSSPQIPPHSHPQPGRFVVAAVPALYNPAGQFTGWNGGDLTRAGGWTRNVNATVGPQPEVPADNFHNHPVSGSGLVNTPFNTGVRYMDIIVCKYNG